MSDLSEFREKMVNDNIQRHIKNGWRFEDPSFDFSHSYHKCPDCQGQLMVRDDKYYCPDCRHFYDEEDTVFEEV